MQRLSVDELTERLVLDIVRGDERHPVSAGIIGEIGLDSRSLKLPGEGIAPMSNEEIAWRIGAAERRLLATAVETRDGWPLVVVHLRIAEARSA